LKNRWENVYVSDNREDVLSALGSGNYSLLFCEATSPDCGMLEFCEMMKATRKYRHMPVVVFSSAFNDEEGNFLKAGADAFLFRPTVSVLEAQACSILKNREYIRDYCIGGDFEEFHPESNADAEFLSKLRDYVESNMERPELSVPTIASALNMSASNLFRRIQQVTKMTPNVFLNEMRMARSISLLKENKYEISEIGFMVGYNSPSYFTKCFKCRFGMTPTEFLMQKRKILNRNENQ
ncbi:MAG: helix-turn-helix domain-containing protein, partial [Candidatus Cryptobacteroides sp.]